MELLKANQHKQENTPKTNGARRESRVAIDHVEIHLVGAELGTGAAVLCRRALRGIGPANAAPQGFRRSVLPQNTLTQSVRGAHPGCSLQPIHPEEPLGNPGLKLSEGPPYPYYLWGPWPFPLPEPPQNHLHVETPMRQRFGGELKYPWGPPLLWVAWISLVGPWNDRQPQRVDGASHPLRGQAELPSLRVAQVTAQDLITGLSAVRFQIPREK